MANHMEVITTVYDLFIILSHKYLFLADIKYGYWAINIYLDKHHYLTFHISGIRQLQTICMPQKDKT